MPDHTYGPPIDGPTDALTSASADASPDGAASPDGTPAPDGAATTDGATTDGGPDDVATTDAAPLLTDLSELDLTAMWTEHGSPFLAGSADRQRLIEAIRARLADPSQVDDRLFWCDAYSCGAPLDIEAYSHTTLHDGSRLCEACAEDTSCCDSCSMVHWEVDCRYIGEEVVCHRCLDNYYIWCEICEAHYPDDSGHSHDCGCGPFQTDFRVPNNGAGLVSSEESFTVTLPSGEISEQGMREINSLLLNASFGVHDALYAGTTDAPYGLPAERVVASRLNSLAHDLEDKVGPTWQTRRGNFTRRLSSHAYKAHSLTIPAPLLSEIGTVARQHTLDECTFRLDVTRELNLPPEDFGNEDSCLWGSYSNGRCTLKTNGAFGLRALSVPPGSFVEGRAWVMPVVSDEDNPTALSPTFDTETPDALLLFNGYGILGGYTAARLVAHMYGWTYRKIGLRLRPIYVNSERGYLVAPEPLADRFTDGQVSLDLHEHDQTLHITTGRVLTDA